MAGILTFNTAIVATGTYQQLPANPTAGKLLNISAPAGNTADITIASSSSGTGAFILPKGQVIQLDGVTNFNQLYVSGTTADKVSGVTGV